MKRVLPGGTLGILGSGQLGRMLALAARRMGYRVHVFSPLQGSPAGQVADLEVVADYDDALAAERFAAAVDVMTLEFENIPAATLAAAARKAPVRPGQEALYISQNRLREKTYFRDKGFPVAPFYALRSEADLAPAAEEVGFPAVLKTAGFGYDGKGQVKVETPAQLREGFAELAQEAVLEAYIPFEREVSVVVARNLEGSTAHYGVIENEHRNHVLDISFAPAASLGGLESDLIATAEKLAEGLSFVGVMCVEFFVVGQSLLVNEMAPRPHNSGHLTIEGFSTSQFEQQLRAVCGLPLGATTRHRPVAMANLLGDVWRHGPLAWTGALALPEVSLHLYGKTEARPGRKMGHLTALADTSEQAVERVLRAREALEL